MGAAIRGGFLKLLQLNLRILQALAQHGDFFRGNGKVAAHFLGRRAAAGQLAQYIGQIVLNTPRHQLGARARATFGFNQQLGKQDAIALMLRRMFGELFQGPFPKGPVFGHCQPESSSKNA